MSTRIIFAGSPAVAVPYLRALCERGLDIAAVVTRVDSPVGRKRVVTPTAVALEAERLNLPTIKTNSLRETEIPDADLGIIVAYGGMIPDRLLNRPVHGWINVHFSLLPAYRGAAPLQRAMWDGLDSTGITIFTVVSELDAGPVFYSREIPFAAEESASEALARIALETSKDLVTVADQILSQTITSHSQSGGVSFAPRFVREDGRINWSEPSSVIRRKIRAVTVEPGAFTTVETESFGILRAGTGDDSELPAGEVNVTPSGVFVGTGDVTLELLVVQPPGKPAMAASDWGRGLRAPVVFS
jgi:methionyl-tRNA formyltransferase